MASIKRRPDGRWRARYRDEAGREHARHFERRVDGQRWLDEVTASTVTGMYVDPKAGLITFTRYFAEWAERQLWATGTDRAMRLAARCTTFGDVPMKSLRRSHVEKWVKAMQARGLAPGTIRTRFNNVRTVLRAAVRDRIVAVDPGDGVVLPRARRADVAMVLPTSAQVRALLDAAGPEFRTLIALAAFAGMRLGEAAAVQLGDVNFLGRVLQVTRQVQRGPGGAVVITPPKYGSERAVFLAVGLVEMLSVHVPLMTETDEEWLFVGEAKEPPHQNTVGHRWRKTCKAAGVTGVTLHDLRHFYASGLIAQGCDVVTVQRALGHAKATTTLQTYAHLWPTAEDRTRKAADSMISEVLADPVRTTGSRKGA
jgi:integrase